jgi:type VII secretion integral membrane protein EccD
MTETSVAGLCRLTIRAPAKTVDLAVPADIPVADILPAVLRYAGEDIEENGLEQGGWALQRLGEQPLNDNGTLETLGLRDGEVLYLRPHTAELPAVRLDDLVDGIADVTRDRLHGWSVAMSRRLLRGLLVVLLVTVLGMLACSGGQAGARAVTLGAAGLLLLAGAGTASRAVGDAAAGATLGVMAAPYLAAAGWLLPGGDLSGPGGYQVFGARLLAAGAAGAAGAVLALAAVAVYTPLFLGSAVVAVAAALAGTLMSVFSVPMDDAAEIMAAVFAVLGGFVPAFAFRLAGMRMPHLPVNADELQQDIEPYESRDVATRAEVANVWMTALYATIGTVCASCLVALAWRPDLPELLTELALSLLLLLHARGVFSVWQRLTLVATGAWGVVLLLVSAGITLPPKGGAALVAGALALAAVLAITSWTVPGRRMSPYWGRAAEVLHSLLAISLLPLTLWVLGLFALLRGMTS